MLNRQSLFRFSKSLVAVCLIAWAASSLNAQEPEKKGKLYELRFYVANPGKLSALHDRFRNHTLKLFEKHGIENIIYWDVVKGDKSDGDKAENTMVYIIAHKDEAARDASWKAFRDDPDWKKAAEESEKDGKLLAQAPVVILMRDVEFSPPDETPNSDAKTEPRLFELRQYKDGPERVPYTVDRFGSGEVEVFQKAGMETLKFWRASDDSAFIYLLGHKDDAASDASWKAFMKDFPSFLNKYKDSGKGPPETAAKGNGIEVRFLKPTDYSPRK
jgi:hypothetical protein